MLVGSTPFIWGLHAAQTPGRGRLSSGFSTIEEASATLLLRSVGVGIAEPLIHAVATCVHWIVFIPKYLGYEMGKLVRRF